MNGMCHIISPSNLVVNKVFRSLILTLHLASSIYLSTLNYPMDKLFHIVNIDQDSPFNCFRQFYSTIF